MHTHNFTLRTYVQIRFSSPRPPNVKAVSLTVQYPPVMVSRGCGRGLVSELGHGSLPAAFCRLAGNALTIPLKFGNVLIENFT